MPALVAFGRKWQVASDDLVIPGFLDFIIRTSWIIAGSLVYWKEVKILNCEGGEFIKIYLVGLLLLCTFMLFADLGLMINSMHGVIMDTEARKNVVPALYFRLFLMCPEIVLNGLGNFWVYSKEIHCTSSPEALTLIKVVIYSSWGLIAITMFFTCMAFDPIGSPANVLTESTQDGFESMELYEKIRTRRIWEKRCKILFCSCFHSNHETSRQAFREISKIMGYMFEDLDFVPSDLAAGLIILHLRAKAKDNQATVDADSKETESTEDYLEETGDNVLTRSETMNNPNITDWNSPVIIAHFMRYAMASYGWPWYIVANPKFGLCNLWKYLFCCYCSSSSEPQTYIEGDNCCFCNTAALLDTTLLDAQDLLYGTFENEVFENPFFIAADHKMKVIVVAIRGTLSLRDAITDLTAQATSIDAENYPSDFMAHSGMLQAARNLHNKLNSMKILEKAFQRFPHYSLLLTGHSLGAGAAAILSLLLRPVYHHLRCYCYSPPGGLMSIEAAKYSESFVVSVVVGDDIVARLSLPSLHKFKEQIVEAVTTCKTQKYRILMGGCWYLIFGAVTDLKHEYSESTESNANIAPANSHQSLLKFHDNANYCTYVSLAEVSHKLQKDLVTKLLMYLPGRIFHVQEEPVYCSRRDMVIDSHHSWKWVDREQFSKIIVTPKMLTHHYPDNVMKALNQVADIAKMNAVAPNFV